MAKWNPLNGRRRTYDDAIGLLNTLQTPYKELQARRLAGIKPNASDNEKLKACVRHLGYAVSDLNRLNIVHITGTKGKGSICAYVDSIFRHYRLSYGAPSCVGLFTSPHLISVRERIKINSKSISAENFTKYFFQVWDRFETPFMENGTSKLLERPGYFRYLTLLSYHIFLQERVDAAIYEVGIGGEYDSTNIVPSPAVTGISSIDLDHTFILGETIAEIAWNKAGIMKKGCPNYSVPQHYDATRVLNERALEREVLYSQTVSTRCQPLSKIEELQNLRIRPHYEFQRQNALMGIYLADVVLKKLVPQYSYSPSSAEPYPPQIINGLEQVTWRGRCERIEEQKLIWYLDGAHTKESIELATMWFASELNLVKSQCQVSDQPRSKPGSRILIYNQQGFREVKYLLEDLCKKAVSYNLYFDHVIFCPTVPVDMETRKDSINLMTDKSAIIELTQQKFYAEQWKMIEEPELFKQSPAKVHIFSSLEDSIKFTRELSLDKPEKPHVFVTGSIHLVGRVIGILEEAESL